MFEQNTVFPRSVSRDQAAFDAGLRQHMLRVYNYMASGVLLTGIVAMLVASTPALYQPIFGTPLKWVVMLAPLGLVFAMGGLVNRMSGAVLLLTFIAFSAIMGISLCYVFIAYSPAAIIKVFLMTSGVFAIMAIAGYTTKTDLTKLGSLLFIGLIGIVLASLANMLIGSSTMDYVISIIGVVVFTGLTAYDVQRLKAMGEQVAVGSDGARKMALMGSLSLYLNFINLFLMLLRLFGGGRD